MAGTPAEQSGVMEGDILLKINNKDVEARDNKVGLVVFENVYNVVCIGFLFQSISQLQGASYPLALTLLRGALVEACVNQEGVISGVLTSIVVFPLLFPSVQSK